MKKIGTLLLLIMGLSSCNEKNQKMMQINDNEKIVKQYFEHFNNHDFVKMAGMYADTAAIKDPSFGNEIIKQTRQQIAEKYRELANMFPDVNDRIVQIYPSRDNHIIVEFISSSTGPDKKIFELPVCTIFTIEDGLITKDFTYYDNF